MDVSVQRRGSKVLVPSPPCFLRLPGDLRSGAHNEIKFPQFKFSFAKFVSNSDMCNTLTIRMSHFQLRHSDNKKYYDDFIYLII
ncbi:hypothetical protein AHAS_Ahas13G0314600 [Arachis hypogaea]